MRLAFVHKRYGCDGGTERMLHGLAQGLGERGHEIDVLCASYDPDLVVGVGVRLRPLRARGPGSFLRSLALFAAAKVAVRGAGYDLVVHFGRTGPDDVYRSGGGCHRRWLELLGDARGRWYRVALFFSLRHRFLLWHERAALRRPANVVVPSEQARGDLIDAYGPRAERVRVLSNGVDLRRFHPCRREELFCSQRAALGIGPEERVLLFIGSDYWRKGLDRVLAALSVLVEQGESVRLLVAGGDRRQASHAGLASRSGLGEQVLFLGPVKHPERLYAVADLFVLPTRHDPFANVTLEALASGVPVLTSRVNGAVDLMPASPGVTILTNEGSAEPTAAQISAMIEVSAWEQRSQAARVLAEQFSGAAMTTRWEDFLSAQVQHRRSCA